MIQLGYFLRSQVSHLYKRENPVSIVIKQELRSSLRTKGFFLLPQLIHITHAKLLSTKPHNNQYGRITVLRIKESSKEWSNM